jgi:hypothetical protein
MRFFARKRARNHGLSSRARRDRPAGDHECQGLLRLFVGLEGYGSGDSLFEPLISCEVRLEQGVGRSLSPDPREAVRRDLTGEGIVPCQGED